MTSQTPPSAQGKTIAANGINIYYEESGTGKPLILLHGGTATRTSWAAQLPTYAQEFHVFALDSRGHGKTNNPIQGLESNRPSRCTGAFPGLNSLSSQTLIMVERQRKWLTPV